MQDHDILKLFATDGFSKGWEALFRKYHLQPRLIGWNYRFNYSCGEIEEVCFDAIEKTARYLEKEIFILKNANDQNSIVPLVILIARRLLDKIKDRHPLPMDMAFPGLEDVFEPDLAYMDKVNMLLLHVLVLLLGDIYALILLLKYFPDTTKEFGYTDAHICSILEKITGESWNIAKLGVYRRRAIEKLDNLYRNCDQNFVTVLLNEETNGNYKLLSIAYPIAEVLNLTSTIDVGSEDMPTSTELVRALDNLRKNQEKPQIAPRFRIYLDKVTTCMNHLSGTTDTWTLESVKSSISVRLEYFKQQRLAKLAACFFDSEDLRQQWLEEQRKTLLEESPAIVIKKINDLENGKGNSEQQRQETLNYMKNNLHRMNYKKYRQRGLFIGSGAIESAHRTRIRDRMKRSGQRWSIIGANNMINLRVCHKSNRWGLVTQNIRIMTNSTIKCAA